MLNINPWNMVMIVINLLVLYAIFRKFLYKPVMNVIHRREELIQGQFDSAKKTQDDALQLKADYEEKLQKANVKADEIILTARDQAKEEHEKAVLETQAKTDRMIECLPQRLLTLFLKRLKNRPNRNRHSRKCRVRLRNLHLSPQERL